MTELFVVWTPTAFLTAFVGGSIFGFVLVSRFENPRFDAIESGGVIVILGVTAGLVFWSGQAVETYNTEGESLAWRVVSRFLLWGVFTLAMAAGTALGVRFRRGSWRMKLPNPDSVEDATLNRIEDRLVAKIDANTRLTQRASDSADKAYDAANSVNEKIAAHGDTLVSQGEAMAADREVGKDTNETAHRIDERVP